MQPAVYRLSAIDSTDVCKRTSVSELCLKPLNNHEAMVNRRKMTLVRLPTLLTPLTDPSIFMLRSLTKEGISIF